MSHSKILPGYEWHEELDSTNARALLLAQRSDVQLPTVIVADRQTAGRGRGTNQWWSGPGALTFSILLDASEAHLPAVHWPLVSLLTAVVVGETLASYLPGADVRFKWPNDVYVDGRKICGILVEVPPVRPARLVIGVGINVNNSLVDAPAELMQRATSMIDIAGQEFDREATCSALLDALLAELPQLASNAGAFLRRWPQRCLLTGKQVTIDCTTREVRGLCEGLDGHGALLVRTPQGTERLFAGVVKHWE